MVRRINHPGTNKPIHSLKELKRVTRKAAGLQEYRMDDPERPFTDEYEEPVVADAESYSTSAGVGAVEEESAEAEDTTPSADNRALYAQPTTAELHTERVRQIRERYLGPARAVLRAANETPNTETQKPGN